VTKPVILAIDDDASVLGAIERDLRQHYRSDYRVMRAASGAEGLSRPGRTVFTVRLPATK